jgi:hypothetical protein
MKRGNGAGRAEQLRGVLSKIPVPQAQAAALALGTEEQLRPVARRIGSTVAHQFGLTEDEEGVGWKILAVLAFELYELKLKAPLKAAWTIEQQLSGLIEQAYQWLGGAATALADGAAALASDLTNEVSWSTEPTGTPASTIWTVGASGEPTSAATIWQQIASEEGG